MLRRVHLLVGITGILVFLGTGLYLRTTYDMETLDGGPRMLLRSRHVYILLTSLVNLALGISHRGPDRRGWRRGLGAFGSLLLLAAPPMLVVAFFRDATRADMMAPLTPWAIKATLAGTLAQAAASVGQALRA